MAVMLTCVRSDILLHLHVQIKLSISLPVGSLELYPGISSCSLRTQEELLMGLSPAKEAPQKVCSKGRKKVLYLAVLQVTPCSTLRITAQSDMSFLPNLVSLGFPSRILSGCKAGTKCSSYSLMPISPLPRVEVMGEECTQGGKKPKENRWRGANGQAVFHRSAPGLPVHLALLLWVLQFEATLFGLGDLVMGIFSLNYLSPQLDGSCHLPLLHSLCCLYYGRHMAGVEKSLQSQEYEPHF